MMFTLSAFLVGFLGSFHCAGMCGPIAMALPVRNKRFSLQLGGRLLYNAGRVGTYAALGSMVGLLGQTLVLAGFQKGLSIVSGVVILAVALLSLLSVRQDATWRWLLPFTSLLKEKFRKLFGKTSPQTLFLIGSLNGLLPCGFVYIALAAAASAGSVAGSVTYMILFGLGTLPMMLILGLAGNLFGMKASRVLHRATPYVAIAVAGLLIFRGLTMEAGSCCHP